ncbi:helix-turn-helix transcriptional regulator [Dyadobacter subterraneus]|uniref:Helix-turn-helix transcriptional regulator n=1 Tax=Dyadobacter subterraneus TaxID=2773304 RepID=A0ABR9W5Q8_9BACT|nr:helix-turn-helix transcriptional regulator [Dyadobacter subterraneus]MBE9460758.1 helix-turn-helix transcriptional regulator [Dyadobacter subterraneus]
MEKVLPRSLSVYPTVHFLSRKEREVLVLVAMGMTLKEISIKLDVLPKSIDNYKDRITKKLGVNGYGALGHFAFENKALLLELGVFLFPKPVVEISKVRTLPFKEMENTAGGGNRTVKYRF